MATETHVFSGDVVTNTGQFTGSGGGLSSNTVPRASIAYDAGALGYVVYNSAVNGSLLSEIRLANTRGGTGVDSSGYTGIAHVAAGVWSASTIVNADISASAGIVRTKMAAGSFNYVLINDGAGLMSSEAQLAASRGGTGISTAASTGIAHVAAGVWSVSTIVNADVSASAGIVRTKLASGSFNHVLINDGTGVMTSEAQLAASRGGTGISTSASTGVPSISAGTWSVNATLANTLGGTAQNSSAWTGVPYVTTGTWSVDTNYLAASHGGTGISTSASTGVPSISAGTWSVNATLANTLGGTAQNSSAWTGAVVVTAGVWSAPAQLTNTRGGTGVDSSGYTGIAHIAAGVWSASTIVNTDVSASAAVARSKLASGTINHVLINDGTGVMSSEAQLANTRGGTGADSSGYTGIAHIAAGVWSASTIVNTDVSASAAIARSKLASGTANYVVINDGTGVMSNEQRLALSRGGTNASLTADVTNNQVLVLAASGTAVTLVQYTSSNTNSTLVTRGGSGQISVGALDATSTTITAGGTETYTGASAGVTKQFTAPSANSVISGYGTAVTTGASQTVVPIQINTTADYASVVEVLVVVTQATAAGVATGTIKLTQRFNRTTAAGTVLASSPAVKIIDLDAGVSTADIDLFVSSSNVQVRCKSVSEGENLYWQAYATVSHRAMSNV